MKKMLSKSIAKAVTLNEIRDSVLEVLTELKLENNHQKIGYVSGIISSDGLENLPKNVAVLQKFTETLRKLNNYPIFSATDIFTDKVYKKINAFSLPPQHFLVFWRDIIGGGQITDIFMTPRWEKSTGAQDEYKMALKINLNIHFVDNSIVK